MSKIIIILLTIWCTYIFAEIPFKEYGPFKYSENGEQIEAKVDYRHYVTEAFIDFDGDDDLDMILIENEVGDVTYFENIGNREKHDYTKEAKPFTVGGITLNIPKGG